MKVFTFCILFNIVLYFTAISQPINDEPCNAIAIAITPNLEECTPGQAIQWAGATATTLPNPACGSGQLLDVWYKFVASANGKVNVRTSLPVGASNDGAMAVYSAASCSSSLTEVGCNDDYAGINPGLSLTSLTAGQTYYIRFWTFDSATGNYQICLSNPAPPPPAIDPNKRVGVNYDYPETNLDVNGEVQIRGGNPETGKVLTSINDKGKAVWRNISATRKLFKATMSSDQTFSLEARVQFDTEDYDIGNGYDPVNKKYVVTDSIGSVYQYNLVLSLPPASASNYLLVHVYQNNVKVFTFNTANHISGNGQYGISTFNVTFELKTLTSQDDIYINVFTPLGFGIYSKLNDGFDSNPATASFFSGQKIY